jgi:hypothetical protein
MHYAGNHSILEYDEGRVPVNENGRHQTGGQNL